MSTDSKTPKKVLITGASGYIGTYFTKWVKGNEPGIVTEGVSLRDDSWKNMDFSGYDAILHLAGIAHADVGGASEEEQERYYRVNRDLTLEVAKKAMEDGVGQFIFMSSIIVYGDSAPIGIPKMITPKTVPHPANFYGDSKLQAEEGLMELVGMDLKGFTVRSAAACREGIAEVGSCSSEIGKKSVAKGTVCREENVETAGTPSPFAGMGMEEDLKQAGLSNMKIVIVRPPMIYGPGSKGNYPQLANIAGKSPIFPLILNNRSMLFVGNLVKLLSLLILNEEQGIFWPQNRNYVHTSQMVEEIARARGKKIALVPGFGALASLCGYLPKVGGLVTKAFGNLTYDREMSIYKEEYRIYNFRKSIELTEKRKRRAHG